jgi:hypothetical protein
MRTKRCWVSNPRVLQTKKTSRKPKANIKLVILNHSIGIKGMKRRYAEEVMAQYVANYKDSTVQGYKFVHYFNMNTESTSVNINLVYGDDVDIDMLHTLNTLNKINK